MSRRHRKKIPTEPQQATIDRLSHDGRGIASIEGKTVFIKQALPGENVEFIYSYMSGKYDEGYATQVLANPSENRAAPPCDFFGICGGCSQQHIDPKYQIELKQQTLIDQLKHIGGIDQFEILPPLCSTNQAPTQQPISHKSPIYSDKICDDKILESETITTTKSSTISTKEQNTLSTLGYRGKARLGVRHVRKKERVLIGFREANGRFLADMNQCEVLVPEVGHKIKELTALVTDLSIYNEIAQIEVSTGDEAVALIFRHLKPFDKTDLEKLTSFGQQHNFHIYLQPGKNDTVHSLWPEKIDRLSYQLPDFDLTLKFHPMDFTQVNQDINKKMVNLAIDLLEPQKDEIILDLFCGLGNFTLPLATKCKQVTGVEGSETMVARISENAKLNNLTNIKAYAANLEEPTHNPEWFDQTYDKLLIDPPRSGAQVVVENIERFKAKQILYISCNPATLARDAGILKDKGYKLLKAGVINMFPHTNHVESIALFSK